MKPVGLGEDVLLWNAAAPAARLNICVFVVVVVVVVVVVFQETKPSSQDGGDKKDGEYIKLKVIGQVCGVFMHHIHHVVGNIIVKVPCAV